MALFIKIAVAALLLLLLFNCQRKKVQAAGLEPWLEKNYPGRFRILSTRSEDVVRNLSFKVKNSVVEEKSGPGIQALLRYDLRQPGLNLDTGSVNESFTRAKRYWEDANALYQAFADGGISNPSVGIRDGRLSVLYYLEPTPEQRRQCLTEVEKALDAWGAARKQYDVEVLLLETKAQSVPGGKALTLVDLQDLDGTGKRSVIYRAFCAYDQPFRAAAMNKQWEFNSDSERFGRFLDQSQQVAEAWLKKNKQAEYRISNESEFEQSETVPGLLVLTFKCEPVEQDSAKRNEIIYLLAEFSVDEGEVKQVRVRKDKD